MDTKALKYKFEELKKNKLVLGIISLILALIVLFIIAPVYLGAIQSKVKVCIVKKDIIKNNIITSEDIEIVEVGGFGLSNDIIKSKEECINKYAINNMISGQYVLKQMLSDVKIDKDMFAMSKLNGINTLISFKIDTVDCAVAGKLKEGDIISIYKENEDKSYELVPELQYVEVVALSLGNGKEYKNNENIVNDTSSGINEYDTLKIITVVCSPYQAEKIAYLNQNNDIYVSLDVRDNEKLKNYFLEKQENYINVFDNFYEDEEKEYIKKLLDNKEDNTNSLDYINISVATYSNININPIENININIVDDKENNSEDTLNEEKKSFKNLKKKKKE